MDIKKAYSLTFSPTGGTKKIAEHIASAVCERSEFLDVTVKAQDTDFGAEDFVVIAVPVFGGRVPSPVAERLSHVSAQNTPAAIVAVWRSKYGVRFSFVCSNWRFPSLKPVRPIKRLLLEPSLLLTESHSFFQFNFNHEQDIYRRIGWY